MPTGSMSNVFAASLLSLTAPVTARPVAHTLLSSVDNSPSPVLAIDAIIYALWVIGPLTLLLLLSLLWTRSLRNKVHDRTRELAGKLAEYKLAEEALRRSEAIREQTEEISLVMVAHGALDGRWLKVPGKLCALTGYTEPELLSRTWRDITHADDIARDQKLRDRLIRGEIESFELEKRYVRKDGSLVWADITCSAVRGEDEIPRYLLIYVRDISARKQAQEALSRSEERYRSLVQATTSIIWVTNAQGEFFEPQESWEHYTGQPWEEHRGNGWAKMIHPDDLEDVSRQWNEVLTSGAHTGVSGRIWHAPSGEYHRFEARGVPVRRADGTIREWVGNIIDVEENVRAKTALEEVESRFRQMAESSPDVFWFSELDPPRVRYANPAFERIWGDPVESLYQRPHLWQERIHVDDRARVREMFARFARTNGASGYAAEFRVVHPDGRIRWVYDRGVPMKVEGGRLRLAAGIASDITERKETENRQAFMMQELDHRVKNNLAAVLSIAETTIEGSRSLADFSDAFRGRIMALARSHVALAESHWNDIALAPLVEQTLSPYQDCGATIIIEGHPVKLPPASATAVSMTLNELCTNAAKHGAFSTPAGRLTLRWDVQPPPANGELIHPEAHMTIDWHEQGVTLEQEAGPSGIGLQLMKGLVEHELGGAITFSFQADGLRCTVRFPLNRDLAPSLLK